MSFLYIYIFFYYYWYLLIMEIFSIFWFKLTQTIKRLYSDLFSYLCRLEWFFYIIIFLFMNFWDKIDLVIVGKITVGTENDISIIYWCNSLPNTATFDIGYLIEIDTLVIQIMRCLSCGFYFSIWHKLINVSCFCIVNEHNYPKL